MHIVCISGADGTHAYSTHVDKHTDMQTASERVLLGEQKGSTRLRLVFYSQNTTFLALQLESISFWWFDFSILSYVPGYTVTTSQFAWEMRDYKNKCIWYHYCYFTFSVGVTITSSWWINLNSCLEIQTAFSLCSSLLLCNKLIDTKQAGCRTMQLSVADSFVI